MVRILGINIPSNKRGVVSLTYIYGIGKNTSIKILNILKIPIDKKVKYWSDEEIRIVRNFILNNFKVEGELRSEIHINIKRLKDINCYRGIRHKLGLPVRGQKTKNNARTRKGKRITVANKKKVIKH